MAGAQRAVGLNEVQPLRAADRAPLVAVQVGDQAVVQGVHGEPDAALRELGQRLAQDLDVRGLVPRAPDGGRTPDSAAKRNVSSLALTPPRLHQ